MYCAYCGKTHAEEDVAASVEHVIPYGLGGSNDLTITTCDRSNNDLGSKVDAPFMDFFPVRSRRFFLGLASTKGNEPTLDLGGTGWIDGDEVPISYKISAGNKELKLAEPRIVKTPHPDGSEHWQVSGDPVKVREVIEGKLRKQTKLGKALRLQDGTVLRVQDMNKLFTEKTTVTFNPPVLKTIEFDRLVSIRFFSKLALATGHLQWGETFSRSSVAQTLREHMTIRRLEEVTLPAAIWPETDSVNGVLSVIEKEDHHAIAVMNGEPPVLIVSLFGEYGALIPMGRLPDGNIPTASGEGTVWRIELPSRKLSRFTMSDLVGERSEEAIRRAREAFKS